MLIGLSLALTAPRPLGAGTAVVPPVPAAVTALISPSGAAWVTPAGQMLVLEAAHG